jgi:hypothetical protein
MEQRKLNDQANTLVDLAKVSLRFLTLMIMSTGVNHVVTSNAAGGTHPKFN